MDYIVERVSPVYKMELRKNELLEWLGIDNTLSVQQIADHFSISLPSARRLCTALSDEGRLLRTHGGVRNLAAQQATYSFEKFSQEYSGEKERIAKYASTLVKSHQVIFVESGTTLRQFSMALAERIRREELHHIAIITNSLVNLEILHPVNTVVMLGGQYRAERRDFIGYISELSLRGLKLDYCFIGADAISLSDGVMAMDVDTLRFDTEVIKHAAKTVVLAHSAKFEKHSLLSFMSTDQCACIVTDSGLSPVIADQYRQKKINLVTV